MKVIVVDDDMTFGLTHISLITAKISTDREDQVTFSLV